MPKNKLIFLFVATAVLLGFSYFLSFNQNKPAERISEVTEQAASTENKNECSRELTPESSEGPYYKSSSPERDVIYGDGTEGRKIAVSGYVYDIDCNPIANAWLDFWQADDNGNYDLQGYNLRGHQFTDSEGRYKLETKMPGEYTGRTPHIHVKLRAKESGKMYTTQLYFPTSSQNSSDTIFDERLLVEFTDEASRQARFDFIIE